MRRLLVTTSTFMEGDLLRGYETVYNPYGRRLTEQEVLNLIQKYDPVGMIAGVEPLTERVLSAAAELKVISRCGVGLDSVDVKATERLGIALYNTPEAPVQAVAEMALALMLAWLRKIPAGDAEIRQGNWVKKKGALLYGKTVGIIGCGRIGSRLAAMLQGLGCILLGYDPIITAHPICRMVSFHDVLEQSDILSVHVPLLDSTKHLIGTEVFDRMKSGAMIVNTSRGRVIDESALFTAIVEGKISGAALDVFEEEPYSGNLVTLGDRIVLSPHQSSSAIESRVTMEKEAVENLLKGLEGIR